MNNLSISEKAFNLLNGVVCLYKPAGVPLKGCRHSLLLKLCQDLNASGVRSPEKRVFISGDTTKQLRIKVKPSYADDVLVVGPRFQSEDFKCIWTTHLGMRVSGVCIMGLNQGTKMARNLQNNYPIRTYHLHGQLGLMTKNMHIDGQVVEKGRFDFIKRENFDKLMSTIQASNQKKMFQLAQVDTQSQMAYDLAIKGLIRPVSNKEPLIYGIKCISLELPHFIVEVNIINEYENYLLSLVHEIGLKLRCSAACTAIRCIRYSSFTIDQALLMKHWNLQFVLDNIRECNSVYAKMRKLPSFITEESYFENKANQMNI
ncbi:Pseudouridine synthase, catalytic domain,Pseudouridine synthase II, N-terminal [Cinara cedri]|uniref:Pseudouridine synthase, catalytic domain,Pseudouridine synthase II, N-terminal n=1 Tax=Cinara cedri TaxID=506608 RepID=A0A5E4MUE9_9HEMI|nr:Pseudouridine synthase, catalytic domain,Pseudouridine synthase II, N-terminal [Cinara cedri]